MRLIQSVFGGILIVSALPAEESAVRIEGPTKDLNEGVEVFRVTSPYLGRTCQVDVLLPDKIEEGRRYRTLYVLPVGGEWTPQRPWGNGLAEVRKIGAHNRYGLVCVHMEFDTVPWYGSHASDPTKRHDEYLVKVVVPMIEERYPVSRKPEDRLLLGFSKSGWGAVSLLFRYPEVFGAVCSWDAPMMLDETNLRFGSRPHFGTPEHAAAYVPSRLAAQKAELFAGKPPRLTLLGHHNFGPEVKQFHALLEKLGIPHRFDNSLVYKHHWESGWMAKALEIMLASEPAPKTE